MLQMGSARIVRQRRQWSKQLVLWGHDWHSYSVYDKQFRAKRIQSMIDQVLQRFRL